MNVKSEIIFILTERGGDYDDTWETSHAVSSNIQYLEGYELAILAEREFVESVRARLLEQRAVFNNTYVCPLPEVPEYKDVRKWRAGIHQTEITDEMRAERDAALLFNSNADKLHIARHEDIQQAWTKFVDNYIVENSIVFIENNVTNSFYHSLYPHNDYSSFKIESIISFE